MAKSGRMLVQHHEPGCFERRQFHLAPPTTRSYRCVRSGIQRECGPVRMVKGGLFTQPDLSVFTLIYATKYEPGMSGIRVSYLGWWVSADIFEGRIVPNSGKPFPI